MTLRRIGYEAVIVAFASTVTFIDSNEKSMQKTLTFPRCALFFEHINCRIPRRLLVCPILIVAFPFMYFCAYLIFIIRAYRQLLNRPVQSLRTAVVLLRLQVQAQTLMLGLKQVSDTCSYRRQRVHEWYMRVKLSMLHYHAWCSAAAG